MAPSGGPDEPPLGVGFAAGLFAGATRVLVGHPFDTLKVLQQTGGGSAVELPRQPAALLARLYRGCGPPLLTVGIFHSAVFGIYEAVLAATISAWQPSDLAGRLVCHFAAGTAAGAALALPTCPLANVQVLQQADVGERASVAGWVRRLLEHRGPAGLFRALTPHTLQLGFGRGFYMSSYELSKALGDSVVPGSSEGLAGQAVAAGVAGITGWLFTYPLDVARNNLITDWRCERHTSMLGATRALYREGGMRRLYAGFSYTLVRAVPVAVVTLPSYELAKRALTGPDTLGLAGLVSAPWPWVAACPGPSTVPASAAGAAAGP